MRAKYKDGNMSNMRTILLVAITAITTWWITSPASAEKPAPTVNAEPEARYDPAELDTGLVKVEPVKQISKAPLSPEVAARPPIEINDESSMNIPEGFMLVEGDMIVPENYYEQVGQRGVYKTNFWPGGVVPYEFDGNTDQAMRDAMREAMDDWEAEANVQFVERNGESDYVHIQDDDGNSSAVGMVTGMQRIRIYNWNFEYIIAHELGHCLGMLHEQSRNDRDTYVEIIYANISQTACSGNPCDHNFDKAPSAMIYGPYDFDSVMHYRACAFSVCAGCPATTDPTCPDDTDGGVTIAMRPGYEAFASVIGQRTHFSVTDVQTMYMMYTDQGCPAPDHLAGNSKDNPTDLGSRGSFEDTQLTIHDLEEEDWFQFTACETVDMQVDVTFTHADGDIDVCVYYGDSFSSSKCSVSIDDNESIEFAATAGDAYRIRVYGAGSDNCNSYAMTILDYPHISCPADTVIECDESTDPSNTGYATATNDCGQTELEVSYTDQVTPGGCPPKETITRTWSATDTNGLTSTCDQIIEVVDTTVPTIGNTSITEGEVDENCEFLVEFSATVTDNCCIEDEDVTVLVELTTGNATLSRQDIEIIETIGTEVAINGEFLVSELTSCPAIVTVTINGADCCENNAEQIVLTAEIYDRIPPEITCPEDITLERGDKLCGSDVQDWLDSATATDNCDMDVDIVDDSASNGFACGFPYDSTTTVTWTATDDCGNTDTCSATITIEPKSRVSSTSKGSVLIFPKVELRWDDAGNLIGDTIIQLTNDYPQGVMVKAYMVQGDPPTAEDTITGEREHLGWNWIDNDFNLTHNQPQYWSVATGMPAGTSPFAMLDPTIPLGRPVMDGSGERVMRGYIVLWAVNEFDEEITWNHLSGNATIIDYGRGSAWQYNAMTFDARCNDIGEQPLDCTMFDENGTCCTVEPIAGELIMDGFQYDTGFGTLLLDFFAPGTDALSTPDQEIIADTGLTLLPLKVDVRQEHENPPVTKAMMTIWNMNEFKFSGTEYCVSFWNDTLLGQMDPLANNFLVHNLHTDKGKARINGVASTVVCGEESEPLSLLGLGLTRLSFETTGNVALAGTTLVGMGTEDGSVRADVEAPDYPQEKFFAPVTPMNNQAEANASLQVQTQPLNELSETIGLQR